MTDGPERGQIAAVPRRDPDTASRKMPAVDEATRRPRKRSKYAEKACNRCKKKKIRCNAQMPCNQCETRNRMDCCYGTARAAHNPAWSWDNPSFSNTWSLPGGAINTPNLTDSAQLQALPRALQEQSEKLDVVLDRISTIERALGRSAIANPDVPTTSGVGEKDILRIPDQFQSISATNRPLPLFKGVTSPSLYIKIVEMSLEEVEIPQIENDFNSGSSAIDASISFNMHLDEIIHDGCNDVDESDSDDPFLQRLEVGPPKSLLSPLEDIQADEAKRLVIVFDEMVNSMYPVVNAEDVMKTVDWIYSGDGKEILPGETARHLVDKSDINILKMVLATALVAEGPKDNPMSLRLYKSLQDDVEMKIWSSETDLKGLILLLLVSLCHMYRDKWRLAWRTVGNLLRILLELRLNQHRVLYKTFPQREDQVLAINTIWSIVVLDRQLCPALGLPVSAHEAFLDPKFPDSINSPYLKLILNYSQIGMRVCGSLAGDASSWKPDRASNSQDLVGYHMYLLGDWQKSVPEDLQFVHDDSNMLGRNSLLRSSIYLRRNHLQILIVRPSLCSHTWSKVDSKLWTVAINAACDSIQVLSHLNETSDMYRYQQTLFNYFFATALGILMLMISRVALEIRLSSSSSSIASGFHQPTEVGPSTYENARHGILVALTLLRTLLSSSHSSRLSRRLWTRLLSLCYRIHLLDMLNGAGSLFAALDQEIDLLNGNLVVSDITDNNQACQRLGRGTKRFSDYDFGYLGEIWDDGLE